MPLSILLEVAVLILAVALAYATVGNAGASAYLAAMALFGIAPNTLKPTALVLNILVSLIALIKFARAGCFFWQLFWPFAVASIPFAFIGGALIGLLSGLTGVGGGVFLSPLLLAMGWANMGTASGIAAAFILFNSVASLMGLLLGAASLPSAILVWAPAAVLGGWIGARYGSTHYTNPRLRYLLGIILAVSGIKILNF